MDVPIDAMPQSHQNTRAFVMKIAMGIEPVPANVFASQLCWWMTSIDDSGTLFGNDRIGSCSRLLGWQGARVVCVRVQDALCFDDRQSSNRKLTMLIVASSATASRPDKKMPQP